MRASPLASRLRLFPVVVVARDNTSTKETRERDEEVEMISDRSIFEDAHAGNRCVN